MLRVAQLEQVAELIVVKSQRIFRRRPDRRSARSGDAIRYSEDTDIRDSYVLHAEVSFEGACQDSQDAKTLKVVAIT